MPTGIPIQYLHCKKCPDEKFKTISDLRKHQWSFHRDAYANLLAANPTAQAASAAARRKLAGRKRTEKARAAALAKHAAARDNGPLASVRKFLESPQHSPHVNGDMRVSDLIAELQSEGRFLTDAIALICGIYARYQEAHHV
jgi:hypothetical protein